MKYLLVDTNVFIQCCLLELEGDDLKVLEQLSSLLDKDKLSLLLPEVVALEFEKILQEKTERIINQVGEYKAIINKDNKLDLRIRKDMINGLDQTIKDRKENTTIVKRKIKEIFNHKNTHKLQFNASSFLDAFRAFLANKKPYSKSESNSIQPDCLIIEMVSEYLKDKDSYSFFLCSYNKDDFAQNAESKDEDIVIAEDIKEKFSDIKYYINLSKLLKDNFKAKYTKQQIQKFSSESYEVSNVLDSRYLALTGNISQASIVSPLKLNTFVSNADSLSVSPSASVPLSIPGSNVGYANINSSMSSSGMINPTNTLKLSSLIGQRINLGNDHDMVVCDHCGKLFKDQGVYSNSGFYCSDCSIYNL